jgi:hypothetical protein
MKKKITVLQAFTFVDSFNSLKDSGVSFKGLAAIDMALNCTKIEPLVINFRKQNEPSTRMVKYQEELRQIQIAEQAPVEGKIRPGQGVIFADGARAAAKLADLRKKYKADIDAAEKKNDEQTKALDKQVELDLIEIPKTEIDIAERSDRAAGVLAGLAIVIK